MSNLYDEICINLYAIDLAVGDDCYVDLMDMEGVCVPMSEYETEEFDTVPACLDYECMPHPVNLDYYNRTSIR